jgi:hypothetical protein
MYICSGYHDRKIAEVATGEELAIPKVGGV